MISQPPHPSNSTLTVATDPLPKLNWDELPFSLISPAQQVKLKVQAQVSRFQIGDKIWSTDAGEQCLVISGRVRLREEGVDQSIATLKPGDWFGDCLELMGAYKVVAASSTVVVVRWRAELWQQVITPELEQFWFEIKSRYQPQGFVQDGGVRSVAGYPVVAGLNTAAACLTMVCHQLQVATQLDWVQRQVRGQRPHQVSEAAEKLGLQLRRLRLNWEDLHQVTFPALIHWRNESWIVLYELRGNVAIIANPLNPSQVCESIPKSILESGWDGQLWQVEPLQKQEKFGLSWFLPSIWRYRKLLTEVLIASLTLQLLGLGTPIFTQVIIDKAMVQGSISTLNVMLIALFSVAVFESLLGIVRLFTFTHTARRIDLSLSSQVFRHLLQLPLSYFEARRVGDTVARVQEMENIRQFLTGTALTVALDAVFVVVYLVLMLYYNVTLTGVALAVIPLFSALILISTPVMRRWLNESFNRNADSQSFLVETVTGIHAVKAHATERVARERWEGLFARYVRTDFRAATISNISGHIGDFLTSLSALLILGVGAHLAIQQDLTVGQLVAFQMLSGRVTGPILRLVRLWQDFQQVLLSVDRLGDILNEPTEAEAGSGLVLPPLQGKTTFDRVFFRYNGSQEPILRGISCTIEPGMLVGVVGRSGSGKSTLSKLLQGLYQPESGRVLVDSFDVKSADLNSLRQQISVVLQDDFLFNSSVLENITLGNPDITTEQVIEATQNAAAYDFITELPQGFDTNVGERGTALSGGQRQRVSLSRFFLSQAPILILDEATSALDSETEQQVLRNLKRTANDRTVFMITHRFEPLKQADLILVLDRGVLVEQGTHEALMAQQGLYWSLYQRQQTSA